MKQLGWLTKTDPWKPIDLNPKWQHFPFTQGSMRMSRISADELTFFQN
jgi:hypothetical protein